MNFLDVFFVVLFEAKGLSQSQSVLSASECLVYLNCFLSSVKYLNDVYLVFRKVIFKSVDSSHSNLTKHTLHMFVYVLILHILYCQLSRFLCQLSNQVKNS